LLGPELGLLLGDPLGSTLGEELGDSLDSLLGPELGLLLGDPLGPVLGMLLGDPLGPVLGLLLGDPLGSTLGDLLGPVLGLLLGAVLGRELGFELGLELGDELGDPDGASLVSPRVGRADTLGCKLSVGVSDGVSLGLPLGFVEGDPLGLVEGFTEGESLGFKDGVSLGLVLGFAEGDSLGLAEGESLGLVLGSNEGNELGLWVARITPSIENTPSSLRLLLLISNDSRSCAESTDSPVLTISTIMFTTVVETSCNRLSLSLEVTGDISLMVSNEYKNLPVVFTEVGASIGLTDGDSLGLADVGGANVHPGVHVLSPSAADTGMKTLGSSISLSPSLKASSFSSVFTAFTQSVVQIVTANTTTELIVGL